MGSSEVTSKAGQYTKEIAKAVHRGFVRLLKRKEPGRIRAMLRHVSARIRKDGANPQLRWSEKGLKKAIDQWSAAYAVEQPPEEPDAEMESSENAPDQGGVSSSTTRPTLASDGISFDVPKGRKLSEPIRRSLKKIHCNLGHPSKLT